MKFSYVTFVPNKQQQQQQQVKGKRSKPLTMVSYFTDTARNSCSDPFDGSMDLSLHFNVETELPSSTRRHVPPPVQIAMNPPLPPSSPQHSPKQTSKPITPEPIEAILSIPVLSPNTLPQNVFESAHGKTVLCRSARHRKPRFEARPKKEVCNREPTTQRMSSKISKSQHHWGRNTLTTTNHFSTVLSHTDIQQAILVVSNSRGQREETKETSSLIQNLNLNKEQALPNTTSCRGSSVLAETTVSSPAVPKKVRTSISIFELLNPEE
ncbi:hypothetical protein FDP41_003566 [Naegleria fowleri]|uniref:Uncharacterized protein n=1 Tax=Naegleria fowleri TaxID=5763 RepID=A0A6A5BTL3_NAEFO|nr:uncharacterized protein FDP41_003566 [Naegleria fowleri]KAF0977574.1 hypothetical protein FDP41_003566 [Naegleria fowleri]